MIAFQAIVVVQTYLKPDTSGGWTHTLTSVGILAILWLAGSAGAMGPTTTIAFITLVLVAAYVLARLIRACLRAPDPLGWAILIVFAIVLATGVHDLVMHLGRASLSDGYLQGWALPVVIILSVLALARRAAEQRQLEGALRRSDSRREDLIRDLHDRVGSRLVALAFHAQQYERNPTLVEEIRDLISEVRMMQNAVASDATTLEALLADLRHLYSRVGGGRLPLDWRIQETVERIDLGPDRVIAVVRIIEEAVANAIRHASPSRITIRLAQEEAGRPVRVEIENDGVGTIRPAPSGAGGLNNMRARAEAAGLNLDFVNAAETRSVRISFPITRLTPSSAIARSLRCQIQRTLRLDPKGGERRRG
jgi:signal transduction histidine kinase